VLPGRTGEVVHGEDVEQVADAIAGLLEHPTRAAALGAAGREWVQREWTWEGSVARLVALLSG
jgi:phosphatidylinositol alpha-1,6-mannosyltransferase